MTYSDLADFGERIGLQLVDDGHQHLVTGDLTKMDPESKQSTVAAIAIKTKIQKY